MLSEEEQMTTYSTDELASGWEFKIVRANTRVFGKPSTFNRLLEEEARAGWTMLEKFDDQRIRFKRPREARRNDANLPPGVDPYRVHYGMSPVAFAMLILATALGVTGAVALLSFALDFLLHHLA